MSQPNFDGNAAIKDIINNTCDFNARKKAFKILNAEELLTLKLPPREYVMCPVLGTKGIAMVHAARGTGKTFFIISFAYAIACGGDFLGWKADKPRRVIVLDGEMATEDYKGRLAGIAAGCPYELKNPDNLKILAADYNENGLPDLSTPEGQATLRPYFEDADVVIFDNLSTLFTSLRESENDDSQKANALFLELRRKGKAVIFVHHSGKNGGQRGASRREDILNTVISLKRPDDVDEGCVFNVRFEKARGFYGSDAEPFRAALITNSDGTMTWEKIDIADAMLDQVQELKADGKTQREIAGLLGISPATVNRILKKHKEQRGPR